MISKIFKKIEDAGVSNKAKILCAISGGIDSSLMLHVLNEYGFDCIVAHCNFKLRGEESDRDEKFVAKLAEKLEFKFICTSFDTEKYAIETGQSVQMAARELRYLWFYEMMEKYQCEFIALAHNADDQAETIITNLIRGTGIRGLCGMKMIKNKLFRPLIDISRKDIEEYASVWNVEYVNDSTNATVKYSRNKIRHKVIPLLEEITPTAKDNILKSINYLQDTEHILKDYVNNASLKCISRKKAEIYVDLTELAKFAAPKTVLFEMLIKEGVPKALAVESVNLIDSQSGRSCKFLNIEILKDRDHLIVYKTKSKLNELNIHIDETNLEILNNYFINHKIIDACTNLKITKTPNFAYLDYEKLVFPLVLRNWQDGDKFKPFGMNHYKKLSDFFSDLKLSIPEKQEVLILESSDKKIVWLCGFRLDNRFRVTEKTKRVMVLEMQIGATEPLARRS